MTSRKHTLIKFDHSGLATATKRCWFFFFFFSFFYPNSSLLDISWCLAKNLILFVDTGMGVHSRQRTSLESLIFVYNIWDAIFGSKLGGLFVPRKLCEWVRSFDKDVCGLGACHWFRFASKGISLLCHEFFIFLHL